MSFPDHFNFTFLISLKCCLKRTSKHDQIQRKKYVIVRAFLSFQITFLKIWNVYTLFKFEKGVIIHFFNSFLSLQNGSICRLSPALQHHACSVRERQVRRAASETHEADSCSVPMRIIPAGLHSRPAELRSHSTGGLHSLVKRADYKCRTDQRSAFLREQHPPDQSTVSRTTLRPIKRCHARLPGDLMRSSRGRDSIQGDR